VEEGKDRRAEGDIQYISSLTTKSFLYFLSWPANALASSTCKPGSGPDVSSAAVSSAAQDSRSDAVAVWGNHHLDIAAISPRGC
jgi:hypothetical protein